MVTAVATPLPRQHRKCIFRICVIARAHGTGKLSSIYHTASAKEIDLSLCSKNEDDVFPNNTNLVIDKPKDNG